MGYLFLRAYYGLRGEQTVVNYMPTLEPRAVFSWTGGRRVVMAAIFGTSSKTTRFRWKPSHRKSISKQGRGLSRPPRQKSRSIAAQCHEGGGGE